MKRLGQSKQHNICPGSMYLRTTKRTSECCYGNAHLHYYPRCNHSKQWLLLLAHHDAEHIEESACTGLDHATVNTS